MKWFSFGLPLVAAALVLGACGSDDDDGPPVTPDGFVAEKDFASLYAHAFCDNVGECCLQGGDNFEAGVCLSSLRGRATYTSSKRMGASYRGDNAYSCIKAAEAAARSCTGVQSMQRVCATVYRGDKLIGHECKGSFECAPLGGSLVVCNQGKCQEWVSPREGVACVPAPDGTPPRTFADCSRSPDYFCNAEGKCEKRPRMGSPCKSSFCVDGEYCDETAGRCVPKRPAGSPCSVHDAVCEGYCGSNGFCVDRQVAETCQDRRLL